MKRILYLTNIQVPYRVRFFNELSKKCDLTVLYERSQSGNRNNDFKMANQAMGLQKTPDGYVWHHLDDYDVEKNTITMELVMDEAHNAAKPHSGGCAQYDSVNGPTYNRKKKGYK